MSIISLCEPKYLELKNRLIQIQDLEAAASLLNWDQTTYMPTGGTYARGRQIATLKEFAHQKRTEPIIGKLLEDLRAYEKSLPYDSTEASLIRVTRRDYERAVRVPPEFMAKFSQHQAVSYEAWVKAKSLEDFSIVEPYLEKTLELSRELASFFPYKHIADPLIDFIDEGMTVSILRPLFNQLRQKLRPIVEAITSAPPIDDSCLYQHFSKEEQLKFGYAVIQRIGFDFQRGRQDETPHPFTSSFSIGDVRITTRVYEDNFSEALFSTIHEVGHALYEQGIGLELEGTPLAEGSSSGIHESQSRLWENIVGRSRGFWECFYPQLQGIFLKQLSPVSVSEFYRAINKVARSPIRTDADEVTYNLHVMIRFDLELAMLEGKLDVSDLPEAWNERYKKDLGIFPANDSEGVMQDVHWYGEMIGGMFQGYTLGNLIAAQVYQAAVKYNPEITVAIERGNFTLLHTWLKQNIHQHGRKYTANELIHRVTGKPLSIEPFINYIQDKYSNIYHLKVPLSA
ncbi:MAG: carboxypeptidase M32 [Okeania sp. SIO3I5]|uniref:carboxypeptidase M32 n=1 Tax=Okeania sp. SIO3I5 TaxID=2607805 RepID=UPI0013B6FCA5|nr:carboxypeptidase M32 [Okeania sp. SIO3I5]NEQ36172.1 carboxypeptidase M32 [Okeania sp. SIO3I5]